MKITRIGLFLVLISGSLLMASNARLRTLGSEPAMLLEDDVSINLFPQRINDFNIARVEGLGLTDPGYLLLIGDKGDKWGAWGSTSHAEDLLNIYRSLGQASALRLSFRIHREKQNSQTSDNEMERMANGFNSAVSYGWDGSKSEREITVGFSYGPGDTYNGNQYTNFDYTEFDAADTTTITGTSNDVHIYTGFSNRVESQFFIFENRYDNVLMGFRSGSNEIARENTKTDENDLSQFMITARTFLFNMKDVNDVSKLYYGIGAGLGYLRNIEKDKINDLEHTHSALYFGRLRLASGLEISLNNLDLRIGLNRSNTLYRRISNKTENNTTTENRISEISGNAGYGITTGLGYNYKGLQLNVVLNDQLWSSGPQMLFDSNTGDIFTSLDIVYNF